MLTATQPSKSDQALLPKKSALKAGKKTQLLEVRTIATPKQQRRELLSDWNHAS